MSAHDVAHSDKDLSFIASAIAVVFAAIVVAFVMGLMIGRMTEASDTCGSVEACVVRAEGV